MAGMVHANDVRIAEGLRDIELPADPALAMATWNRTLNDAVVRWHRDAGHDIPDLNELDAPGHQRADGLPCFPHYFVLPMYSSASVLPLPPARTGGDADGDLVARRGSPRASEPARPDAARGVGARRPAVAADPRAGLLEPARGSRRACTRRASSTCACPSGLEGHISNFERTIDGFLAGLPYEQLLPALRAVNVNPFEQPIVDLGF